MTVAKQWKWQLPIPVVLSLQLAILKLKEKTAEGGDCSYAAGFQIAVFPPSHSSTLQQLLLAE